MQITTNTGRILVSRHKLPVAIFANETTAIDAIAPAALHAMIDCPDKETADLMELAQYHAPAPHLTFQNNALKSAVRIAAKAAAEAHRECLILQSSTQLHLPQYKYLYTTSQNRFALSQVPLQYAALYFNPNKIVEGNITEKDLKAVCFLADYDLAIFLLKYTSGVYCPPDTIIDNTHNTGSYHHNRCLIQTNAEESIYVIRDGDQLIPVNTILSSDSQYSADIWQMYLAAAEYQLAFCSLTEARMKQAAASA